MDDGESSGRRSSSRARKVAPKMGAALLDSNTRAQVILLPFPVAETLNPKYSISLEILFLQSATLQYTVSSLR
jgi:hypothetical protein